MKAESDDLAGKRVLILGGEFAGSEGVCVGKSGDGKRWAISPDESNEIVQLVFEEQFVLLIDLSSEPGNN